VQIGQNGAYVFVVRDDRKADLVPVTVARTVGPDTVLSAGLSGGEKVVVEGQLRLVNGAAVQVQTPKGPEGGVAKGAEPDGAAPRRS
jgi:multidrug efflux system membrane fusion protein